MIVNTFRGQFFDYDPITGIEERFEQTPDGKFHIHTYQDVQPMMDAAMRLRKPWPPSPRNQRGFQTLRHRLAAPTR